MKLVDLIQGMTDKRCRLLTTERLKWFPLWMICSVRHVNKNYVITNRPY